MEANGTRYIRAEPALTLKIAKAAALKKKEDSLKKKNILLSDEEFYRDVKEVVEGVKEGESDVATTVVVEAVEGAEESQGESQGQEKGEGEEGVEEGEDDIDSPDFDAVIEVEDVFGSSSEREEGEGGVKEINEDEENEGDSEDESGSEEESEDESEEEEDENNTNKKVQFTAVTPTPLPLPLGDINFSEDYFPVLSASGPKKAKRAWPVLTNENIVRAPVSEIVVGQEKTEKNEGNENIEGGVEGVSTGGVRAWSTIASLSVAKAVITATDNRHTTANSSYNSSRDWSRKPKTYKKNNASMPAKVEVVEGVSTGTDSGISVLPSKVNVHLFIFIFR